MDLYFLALLPFGLLSLWFHRHENHRSTAGFGFLAALAPVLAKGALNLFRGKAESSQAKKDAEYKKQVAAAEEEANRRRYEAEQNSPQALAQRQAYTMKFGRLAGAMGGKDKVPPSILNYLMAQQKAREYVPGANYVEAPRQGGGGWNLGLGIADALSYLDTEKLGGKSPGQPTGGRSYSGFGGGSSFGNEVPKVGAGLITNRSTAPAVTGFTRQPWDQTHLQYSGGAPTVFSPTSLPTYMRER